MSVTLDHVTRTVDGIQTIRDGKDVTGIDVRQRSVAMVYQQFINYPSLTVSASPAKPWLSRAWRMTAICLVTPPRRQPAASDSPYSPWRRPRRMSPCPSH